MGKKDNSSDHFVDETNADSTSASVPALAGEELPRARVLWSPQMEALARLATAAPKDAPLVESIEELRPAIEMDLPDILKKKHRDRSYKWDDLTKPDSLTQYGGIYIPVTRTNHPDLPLELFEDGTGCILYKGQNFLTFTRRENVELRQAATLRQFSLKSEGLLNPDERKYGKKGEVVVEPTAESGGDGGYVLDPTPPDYEVEEA